MRLWALLTGAGVVGMAGGVVGGDVLLRLVANAPLAAGYLLLCWWFLKHIKDSDTRQEALLERMAAAGNTARHEEQEEERSTLAIALERNTLALDRARDATARAEAALERLEHRKAHHGDAPRPAQPPSPG